MAVRLIKRRFIQILLGIGSMLAIGLGYLAWGIYTYGNASQVVQANAVIVLGASSWDEEPSPVFRERINHAIALYQQGYVGTIIFTGGQGDNEKLPEAVVARQYAIMQGVPKADILIETRSRTTEQNLRYAKQIAADYHLITFIIVSDPLHMKRTMLIAQDTGLEAYSSPTPTTRYQSVESKLGFLVHETYYYSVYLLRRPFTRTP
jgi:uncharacterized SAM-binding protein YcdF (DUF218 family)